MYVIGTAGHVDHGKSTLVQALSGINPDRLQEEQARAMTIDLGFAWLTLPSGATSGIVDVPGHHDFIKNMLAGVGGIDAVLLVIAADEGVMPQTREHLAIVDLLQISGGVIALTKTDLVADEEWLELVTLDIAEHVAATVLADAPIIPVSASTGQGLSELRQSLDETLAATPQRPMRGRPRLSIDRSFSISGFGTVVTGTLLDGPLAVGQTVEILPQGLSSRIRGLQIHKEQVSEVQPGTRAAVNLAGVNVSEISRGNLLTTPDWLEPSQLLDTHLTMLPDSPLNDTPLKPLTHNQEVEFFLGATQMMGHARLLGAREIKPGDSGWVQLRLRERIPVLKGDHFIIRQASPSLTLGGGVIVDPLPRRRHRRFQPMLINRLETLRTGSPEELLLAELDRQGPIETATLLGALGLPLKQAAMALSTLLAAGTVFPLADDEASHPPESLSQSKMVVASHASWGRTRERLQQLLANYHAAHPLRVGMPKSELRSRLQLESRLFNALIEYAQQQQIVIPTEAVIHLPEHAVRFTAAQQATVAQLLAEFRDAPYSTPLPRTIAEQIGEPLFNALLEDGQLTQLSSEVVLLTETYEQFVAWLRDYLAHAEAVNVAQVRDQFNSSRKYALALLEYTDAQRLTKRVGDERVLR